MTPRTARRLARGIFALDLLFLAGAVALSVDEPDAIPLVVVLLIAVLGWGGVGSLIAARAPGNPIGWLLLMAATAGAFSPFASSYAAWGLTHPPLPLDAVIGWSAIVLIGPLGICSLPLLFLLYPDGALPSRRWRPVVWVVAAMVIVGAFTGLSTGAVDEGLAPPGWASGAALFEVANIVVVVLLGICTIAALTSLWIRLRRAEPDDRGPIRWLAWLLTTMVGSVGVGLVVASVASEGWFGFALAALVIFPGVLFAIPFAFSIVLLRYGLYDYEVRMRKRIVAWVITVGLTIAALGFIALLGQGVVGRSERGGEVAGLITGVVFVSAGYLLARMFRRFAMRVVFGERVTPYEVLSEFSERIGDTYSTDDVLPRMARLLAAGTGAKEAVVWLQVGGHMRAVATWPEDAGDGLRPVPGDDVSGFPDDRIGFPVVHQGSTLGALSLQMSPNDPMNPSKERLVQDVAAQAGLVLRNVGLVEDLRESRRRIVATQDERARRLERDIHDGAQQQLVALSVKQRIVAGLVERDPERARAILEELQGDTTEALENLRDLARGIYPPLLADKGLAAALEAQGRKAAIPVLVRASSIDRYPQEIESAVYFCCLEALNNIAKYANASSVTLTLETTDGQLGFEVTDDGAGFDPEAHGHGTGIQGMRDRLEAIGGSLEVASGPSGTAVRGNVPWEAA